jgi:sulfofructose kinase
MDIVGIGLCTFDILIVLPELPTWDQPTRMEAVAIDGGGPCGTALCAASKLGARTGFIGTAGRDWLAAFKLNTMTDLGIDISHVVRRDINENQIACVYVHQETGERIFNLSNGFYAYPLQEHEIEREYITQAEYLLLDGHYLEASTRAAEWMHAAGKRVILDGGKTTAKKPDQTKAALVPLSDVLICGSGFAEAITGEAELQAAGQAALNDGPSLVVITGGEKGSFTFTQNTLFHTPAFQVDVVDTTGAGDVFHGAYIFGLLQGWDLETVALFASAASAIECTYLGGRSGLPNFQQVMNFLKKRGINLP